MFDLRTFNRAQRFAIDVPPLSLNVILVAIVVICQGCVQHLAPREKLNYIRLVAPKYAIYCAGRNYPKNFEFHLGTTHNMPLIYVKWEVRLMRAVPSGH